MVVGGSGGLGWMKWVIVVGVGDGRFRWCVKGWVDGWIDRWDGWMSCLMAFGSGWMD